MNAYTNPIDLIDLTPADADDVSYIRQQIDLQIAHKNEQDQRRKAARDANTYARRKTDGVS